MSLTENDTDDQARLGLNLGFARRSSTEFFDNGEQLSGRTRQLRFFRAFEVIEERMGREQAAQSDVEKTEDDVRSDTWNDENETEAGISGGATFPQMTCTPCSKARDTAGYDKGLRLEGKDGEEVRTSEDDEVNIFEIPPVHIACSEMEEKESSVNGDKAILHSDRYRMPRNDGILSSDILEAERKAIRKEVQGIEIEEESTGVLSELRRVPRRIVRRTMANSVPQTSILDGGPKCDTFPRKQEEGEQNRSTNGNNLCSESSPEEYHFADPVRNNDKADRGRANLGKSNGADVEMKSRNVRREQWTLTKASILSSIGRMRNFARRYGWHGLRNNHRGSSEGLVNTDEEQNPAPDVFEDFAVDRVKPSCQAGTETRAIGNFPGKRKSERMLRSAERLKPDKNVSRGRLQSFRKHPSVHDRRGRGETIESAAGSERSVRGCGLGVVLANAGESLFECLGGRAEDIPRTYTNDSPRMFHSFGDVARKD